MSRAAAERPSAFERLEAAFRAEPEANAAEYASALTRAGRARDAVLALQKLHAQSPLRGAARLALARALFDTFRVEEAHALLVDMPSAWSHDAAAQRLLGEIALEREQMSEARTHLRRSYELDPRDLRTRELLVFVGDIDPADLHSEAMTNEAMLGGEATDAMPRRRPASVWRTLRYAVFTAMVLGLIVVTYAWRVRVQAEVSKLCAAAKPIKSKGDWRSLEQADKLYREALELDGAHPVVLGALAEIHALLYFEHGIDRSKNELALWIQRVREVDARTGDRYLGEGLGIVIAGDPTRAERLLLQTIERGGVDARVLFALGIAQRSAGKYLASRDALRRAHELDPFQPTFAVELGDTFLLDSDVKNAEHYWRKAAEANPDHARATSRALVGALLLGAAPASLSEKVDALATRELPPAHRGALLALRAMLALARGERQEAQTLVREANGLRPYDPALDWLVGYVLAETGNKEALAAYDDLLKRLSGLKNLGIEAAFLAARFGQPADGEARLATLKDLAPAKTTAYAAEMYLRAGDVAAATARAERALGTDPAVAEGHYVIGRVRQQKHELQKALEHYSKALQARSVYPEVYHQVGSVYVENKEYDRALEAFGQAEKQYLQAAAGLSVTSKLYDDMARAYDLAGGPDAKQNAERYRAKAKLKGK